MVARAASVGGSSSNRTIAGILARQEKTVTTTDGTDGSDEEREEAQDGATEAQQEPDQVVTDGGQDTLVAPPVTGPPPAADTAETTESGPEFVRPTDAAAASTSRPTRRRSRRRVHATRKGLVTSLNDHRSFRRLTNHMPSTGYGRFDAEYLPDDGKLIITVKVHFTWNGPWTDAEKADFTKKWAEQAGRAWSKRYTMRCTKRGFRHLVAEPEVRPTVVSSPSKAHFTPTVNHIKAGDAFIGREGYKDRTKASSGQFAREDAPERPHDNLFTRCTIALHDAHRLAMFLKANGVDTVSFDGDGNISAGSRAGLKNFVEAVRRTALPSAVPVPLIVTGYDTKKERGGPFRRKDVATQRAAAVAQELAALGHPTKVRSISGAITETRSAMKQALKAGTPERGGYREGGTLHQEAEKAIADMEAAREDQKVDIAPDEAWAKTFKDTDPYSIMAHEFGHMLGNPDEYFGWGPEGLDAKLAQLVKSGDVADLQQAAQLQQDKDAGKPAKNPNMQDDQRRAVQGDWAKLVDAAGQRIPDMGAKGEAVTTSIMSAGTDVLPAHYATMWEALGKITAPTLQPSDWKIDK